MKKGLYVFITAFVLPVICFSQDAADIINKVKKAQELLNTVSYALERTDTLGTYIRNMKGDVMIRKATADTIFGFKFWARKDGDPTEKMYDGHVGYDLIPGSKTYELTTSAAGFYNLLNGGGGHLILPDVVKLDTSKVANISVTEDKAAYYLLFKYADILKYDLSNKFKKVKISKERMLPVSVREHQETLGRIQDLYYEIKDMHINEPYFAYDFDSPDFLKTYKHIIKINEPSPVLALKGKAIPPFKIRSFDNEWVSTTDFKGKVVLLDFWEVWCGPCIASMPKIESLFQKYKANGLLVYGVVNDKNNVDASRILVKRQGFTFPMLIGSEQLRNEYKITGIPLYILIDKTGKVNFISEGFSEDMETVVQKALLPTTHNPQLTTNN